MEKLIKGIIAFVLLAVVAAGGQAVYQKTKDSSKFLELAKRAVVRMSLLGSGTCSATVVSDKYAVTAAHCIPSPPEFFNYLLSFGKPPMLFVESRREVMPTAVQSQVDAALIEGNFTSLNRVIEVDRFKGKVFRATEAVLCGYALYNNQLRCERATRIENSFFAAVFDSTALPGQSGGAVFSLDGELIGIIHSVDESGHTRAASTTGILSLAPLP